MGGLGKILKVYGQMLVRGDDGKSVLWVWDYATNSARVKSAMSREELANSERAKWARFIVPN